MRIAHIQRFWPRYGAEGSKHGALGPGNRAEAFGVSVGTQNLEIGQLGRTWCGLMLLTSTVQGSGYAREQHRCFGEPLPRLALEGVSNIERDIWWTGLL